MSRILLLQLHGPDIEDLHLTVRGPNAYAGPTGMECGMLGEPLGLLEGVNTRPGRFIPNFNRLIVRAGEDELSVRAPAHTAHPVGVFAQALCEPGPVHGPHFDRLVVRAGDKAQVLGGELDAAHCALVRLQLGRVT